MAKIEIKVIKTLENIFSIFAEQKKENPFVFYISMARNFNWIEFYSIGKKTIILWRKSL